MKNNFRSLTIDSNIDKDNLEISLTVASATPCEREYEDIKYDEVLIISEDAIDLTRLNNNASVLKNHDDDIILGQVKKAWIEQDKLCVRIQFLKHNQEAVNIFNDICDGNLRNVSIGYQVKNIEFKKEEDKTIGYVNKWMPFEISVAVGIPFDPNVGFYRSLNDNIKEVKNMEEDKTVENEAIKALECRIAELEKQLENKEEETREEVVEEESQVETVETAETDKEEVEEVKEEQQIDDKTNEEEIRSVAKAFDREDLIESALERKIDVETFKSELKRKINHKEVKVMDNKFNVAKALRSLLNKDNSAEYERTISASAYADAKLPYNNDSIVVRAFDGTTGAGLLPTEHRGDLFVDVLRTKMAVKDAKIISGLQGTITIPAATSASTVAWVEGLGNNAGSTNPIVTHITLTPKKLCAYVDVDKNLIVNASPDAVNLVINDLTEQIARKLDYTILKGNASAPSITGVETATGVNNVVISDMAAATWKDYVKFAGSVDAYDVDATRCKFVMSAADKALLKGTSKDTGSGRFIIEDNALDGYEVSVCGLLESGEVYFGDFSNVVVGNWLGGLEITIDPYSLSVSGGVRVVASLVADVAVTNAKGFAKRVASASPESSSSAGA